MTPPRTVTTLALLCLGLAAQAAPQALAEVAGAQRQAIDHWLEPRMPGLIGRYQQLHSQPELSLQESKTAALVAQMLEDHPRVKEVRWPGLDSYKWRDIARKQMIDWDGNFAPSTLIYFLLKGGAAQARKACERLIDYMASKSYSVTLAVSLGQIRSLIEHPASMTHATIPPDEQKKHGIDPNGVRLSIGLEDPRDIMHDLQEALRKS